jgi:hypothetical protein
LKSAEACQRWLFHRSKNPFKSLGENVTVGVENYDSVEPAAVYGNFVQQGSSHMRIIVSCGEAFALLNYLKPISTFDSASGRYILKLPLKAYSLEKKVLFLASLTGLCRSLLMLHPSLSNTVTVLTIKSHVMM